MELAKERTIKSYMYRYSTALKSRAYCLPEVPRCMPPGPTYSKSWVQLTWIALPFITEATPSCFHNCCRLAQAVLAREEPEETFLKSVPQHLASLQIIHPSSISEKEVRRRLRLLTKQRRRKHSIRMISWAATAAPLTLLLLTPIPALPAYYCLYRAFSHRQALAGCRSLTDAFSHNDAQQLQDLRKGLLEMQTQGHKFDPLGWPTKMMQTEPKYLDLLESVSPESAVTAKAQIVYEKKKLEDMVLPKMVASPELDDIVKPKARLEGLTSPLEDGEVMKVGSLFAINDLLEHVAKARKRVVGAMFPRHVSK
ncbi:hypothetical protein ABBQ38_010671 [Trebouxia sp. C0009 RCD-2024]